jgi:hypothetical protein
MQLLIFDNMRFSPLRMYERLGLLFAKLPIECLEASKACENSCFYM